MSNRLQEMVEELRNSIVTEGSGWDAAEITAKSRQVAAKLKTKPGVFAYHVKTDHVSGLGLRSILGVAAVNEADLPSQKDVFKVITSVWKPKSTQWFSPGSASMETSSGTIIAEVKTPWPKAMGPGVKGLEREIVLGFK